MNKLIEKAGKKVMAVVAAFSMFALSMPVFAEEKEEAKVQVFAYDEDLNKIEGVTVALDEMQIDENGELTVLNARVLSAVTKQDDNGEIKASFTFDGTQIKEDVIYRARVFDAPTDYTLSEDVIYYVWDEDGMGQDYTWMMDEFTADGTTVSWMSDNLQVIDSMNEGIFETVLQPSTSMTKQTVPEAAEEETASEQPAAAVEDVEEGYSVEITASTESKIYDGTPFESNTFSVKCFDENGDEVTDFENNYIVNATCSGTITDAGEVVHSIDGYHIFRKDDPETEITDLFGKITSVDGKLTVAPRELSIKTESAEKVYDGKPLTAGGTVTGLADGESITMKMTGSQTEVGSSLNTYELIWESNEQDKTAAKAQNYTISSNVVGSLKVTQATNASKTNGTNTGTQTNIGLYIGGALGALALGAIIFFLSKKKN